MTTPIFRLASDLSRRIPNEMKDDDGNYSFPEEWDIETCKTFLKATSKIARAHTGLKSALDAEMERDNERDNGKDEQDIDTDTESQDAQNSGGRIIVANAKQAREVVPAAAPTKLQKLQLWVDNFVGSMLDNWQDRPKVQDPKDICTLLGEHDSSDGTVLERLADALERAARGLEYATEVEWEASIARCKLTSMNSGQLANLHNHFSKEERFRDKAGKAVLTWLQLENTSDSTQLQTVLSQIGVKIAAIEAHFAWVALSAAEVKQVKAEMFEHRKNKSQGLEQFGIKLTADMLGCARLVSVIRKIGIYVILDPGFTYGCFRSHANAAHLTQLCIRIMDDVLDIHYNVEWFVHFDNNSVQALMAIILTHDPAIVPSLSRALQLLKCY